MHKLILSICILVGLVLIAVPVWAVDNPPGILLNQVLVGTAESASEEFVEIQNVTDEPVDITGWCIVYTNASSTSKRTLGCLNAPNAQTAIMMPPGGTALFVSTKRIAALGLQPGYYDVGFNAGMSDGGGHVFLIPNASGDSAQAVDEIDWGLPSSPGNGELPTGDVIVRATTADGMQDTDDNQLDFSFAPIDSVAPATTTYLQPDLCLNIDNLQTKVPPGDILDDQGNCTPPPVDVCLNIDGVQPAPPPSAVVDAAGNCLLDICPNIDGVQSALPDDMEFDQTGDCVLIMTSAPPPSESPDGGDQSDAPHDLIVNELLPNPSGSDVGREFIELYNPSHYDISLSDYTLRIVGATSSTTITLPTMVVAAGDYVVLRNDLLNFTLINTTAQVALVRSSDGLVASSSDVYQTAGDDMAWALIDGVWQFTNQPTPGEANVASSVVAVLATTVNTTATCAPNQYRNPETGRCRLLPVVITPAPCKSGQYRSEETDRCRSIAADAGTLTPCSAGEERNTDTNRCHKIATVATTLTPCKAGQQRNPDTNRCRNVKSMPTADYGVLSAKTVKTTTYVWLIVVAVVAGAAVYAAWEWHVEIVQFGKRVITLVKFRR